MSKLLALEKNILKYRAFQMILILYHVEGLRSCIIDSMKATDEFDVRIRIKNGLPILRKKKLNKVWDILVEENIITRDECEDIRRIVDIRNNIAHEIRNLTLDISSVRDSPALDCEYDYSALERFDNYREKILKKMSEKYIISVSFKSLYFEAAENTYREELKSLKKKIDRQYADRMSEIA